MSSLDRYVSHVRNNLGVRPILPYALPLRLGSIGRLGSDGTFEYRGSVESLLHTDVGPVATTTSKDAGWHRTSGDEVRVSALANGAVSQLFPEAPSINARVEVSLGSSNSFLLAADDVKLSVLSDPARLIQAVADAYNRGTWQKDYIVVSQIVVPKGLIVLLSRSSNSAVLLQAQAEALPGGIVGAAADLQLGYQREEVTLFKGSEQEAFFNAYRVKESFWSGQTQVVPLEDNLDPEAVFELV